MPSIRDELLALSQSPAPPALAAVIRDHLVEIEQALQAGRRYSEIIDLLRPLGLSPSVEIFRKTLARIRKEVGSHQAQKPLHRPSTSLTPTAEALRPAQVPRQQPAELDYLDPAARRADIEQWFSTPKPNPLFDLAMPSTRGDREGTG